MVERICKYCNCKFTELSGRQFSNHVRWCDKNLTNDDKGKSNISKSVQIKNDILYGEIKQYEKICADESCKKSFIIQCRESQLPNTANYCSINCSNRVGARTTKEWSDDMKQLASIKSKALWKTADYINKQYLFNRMNKGNRRFTSKAEELIRSYFITTFTNDEWTFGGMMKYKNEGLVRDLFSKKLKICIEYDGIWHFKDIHNQLERKQYKDKLLEEWCIDNKWRLIRIDENVYNKNKSDAINVLIDCVYNKTDQIIKIGDRY